MPAKIDMLSKAGFLDRPEILSVLFHPRKAPNVLPAGGVEEIVIDTKDDAVIGCRLHLGKKNYANILFFHGNGEIAHDYDPIGPVYNSCGLNFIVADYRGYGISTGKPSVSSMLSDACIIFDAICKKLENNGYSGPLWLMGRSLGSAPATGLAAGCKKQIEGLIIESGFAGVQDLLKRLGILPKALDIETSMLFSNAENISKFSGPLLVIHAEHDHIIPLEHGKQLFEASPSMKKSIKIIPDANHNNIFALAGMNYFKYIENFIYQQ